MKRRPFQDVRVWAIQNRSSNARVVSPWVVRWVVEGQAFSRSFRTRALGDRFRSQLLVAVRDGEEFDARTGEPVSWTPSPDELPVHHWVREWLAQEWQDWAPRSRASAVEALVRFVPLVVDSKAPEAPAGMRAHLMATLPPGRESGAGDAERWLDRWVLRLGEPDRVILADIDRCLGLGDRGQPLAASTGGRYRKVSHACVRRAVELGRQNAQSWWSGSQKGPNIDRYSCSSTGAFIGSGWYSGF